MRSIGLFVGLREYSDGGVRPGLLNAAADLGLIASCDGPIGISTPAASRTACENLRAFVATNIDLIDNYVGSQDQRHQSAVEGLLHEAVETTLAQAKKAALRDPAVGLVTSVDLILLAGSRAFTVHSEGDGRIYLYRAGVLHALTQDFAATSALVALSLPDNPSGSVSAEIAHILAQQPIPGIDSWSFEVKPSDQLLVFPTGYSTQIGDQESGPAIQIDNLDDWLAQKRSAPGAERSPWARGLLLRVEHEAELDPRISYLGSDTGHFRIPAFQHLTFRDGLRVLALAERTWFTAGREIVIEGGDGNEFYFLESGSADVIIQGKHVRVAKSGDVIGEMRIFDESAPHRSATVRTRELSSVLRIKRNDLFSLFRRNPVLAYKFCRGLIDELCYRLRTNPDLLSATDKRGCLPS